MLNKKIYKAMMLLTVLVFVLLVGCATSIKLAVERPPTLNTAGIKRITIMPFTSNSSGEMAQYATSVATRSIQEMNYFTLVDPSEIDRLKRSNQNIENYIDAQFTGKITRIGVANETRSGSYKDKDGNVTYYTDYITKVEVELEYALVVARDSRLIGPISKKNSNSSSSRENYPSSSELIRRVIDGQLRYVGNDIAPHTVIETRTFTEDKTKDKALKEEMKNALAQVKAGNYKIALEAYLGIYDRYKSVAAAQNAAILYESFGETQTAANLMQKVYNDTGNPKTKDVLTNLNKVLQDKALLASDYSDTRDQTKKAADLASAEIQKVLPRNARVWIYNDSSNNQMSTAVVDNLTAEFINKGIKTVDRQNAALINAEQKFNMSGNVSDNDFLSVGNAVGANTIVVIGITGVGANRRLQVRVLDIEKRVPIMQSDTSEKWQI